MMEDPIMRSLYHVKDELAARFGYDVEKMGEYYQHAPLWEVRNKPVRVTTAAKARLAKVLEEDETMRELREVRERMWEEAGGDMHKLIENIREAAAFHTRMRGPRKQA